jgi:hypothetical protein
VHITQLKILTSIRVSSKQKKIELNIPKLFDFIHKVYIVAARKIYQNVYLFEKDILPLQQQKHMRECELLIKESIISVIRETMPIENILRAYIDETEEEEIIEESFVKKEEDVKDEEVKKDEDIKQDAAVEGDKEQDNDTTNIVKTDGESQDETQDDNSVSPPKLIINEKNVESDIQKPVSEKILTETSTEVSVNTPIDKTSANTVQTNEIPVSPPPSITFNDTDNVVKFKNKDLPGEINNSEPEKINAPKTIERLEQISTERHKQRKLDELEEYDDDDDGLDKIKIMSGGPKVELGALDIQVLDTPLKLNTSPQLTGVEILE